MTCGNRNSQYAFRLTRSPAYRINGLLESKKKSRRSNDHKKSLRNRRPVNIMKCTNVITGIRQNSLCLRLSLQLTSVAMNRPMENAAAHDRNVMVVRHFLNLNGCNDMMPLTTQCHIAICEDANNNVIIQIEYIRNNKLL